MKRPGGPQMVVSSFSGRDETRKSNLDQGGPGEAVIVPDRRVRNIPEVVLARRWVSWGSGNLEGEGG
jgi:hypothetical protein